MKERSLNAMNADGVGLQVQFVWRQDRNAHTISLLVNERSIPVFESVEGSNIDDWPPSPPGLASSAGRGRTLG